jgi:penicillin amidase
LGVRPLLRAIFSLGPIEVGGDTNTVVQMAVDPFDPTVSPLFAPSLRAVIDVGRWSASRFSLPGGQSGNPLSPHYADLLSLWVRGEGVPIVRAPSEAEGGTGDALRLEPIS